jgi:hypothetical protein
MSDKPPNNDNPIRARRWTPPPATGRAPQRFRSYRFMFRLIGIPAVAVVGVFIYRGLSDRFELPACDSDRAKHTLSDVLKQLKLEPTKYEPLKLVSSTKYETICKAVLPLPEGGFVSVDYQFYWQGDNANMRYTVGKTATDDSDVTPPTPPTR